MRLPAPPSHSSPRHGCAAGWDKELLRRHSQEVSKRNVDVAKSEVYIRRVGGAKSPHYPRLGPSPTSYEPPPLAIFAPILWTTRLQYLCARATWTTCLIIDRRKIGMNSYFKYCNLPSPQVITRRALLLSGGASCMQLGDAKTTKRWVTKGGKAQQC